MKISKPTKPREPDPDACCGTGCVRCVWDLYDEAMEAYAKDLDAWETAVKQQETISRTVALWRPQVITPQIVRMIEKHLHKTGASNPIY